jgi:hypothetical protein
MKYLLYHEILCSHVYVPDVISIVSLRILRLASYEQLWGITTLAITHALCSLKRY